MRAHARAALNRSANSGCQARLHSTRPAGNRTVSHKATGSSAVTHHGACSAPKPAPSGAVRSRARRRYFAIGRNQPSSDTTRCARPVDALARRRYRRALAVGTCVWLEPIGSLVKNSRGCRRSEGSESPEPRQDSPSWQVRFEPPALPAPPHCVAGRDQCVARRGGRTCRSARHLRTGSPRAAHTEPPFVPVLVRARCVGRRLGASHVVVR